MKRIVKIGFPIACVVVIGGTFFALNKLQKKVKVSKKDNTVNTSVSENVSEKIDNDIDTINEVSFSTPIQNDEQVKDSEKQNEEKAIEILKKTYSLNDDVYFTNEGKEDNSYIIAVRNKDTTAAKIYYEVNIENEKVNVHY